jgi:hypothetical protein
MASECVDRSGSSFYLTTMRHAARDEVFLTCLHRNPFSVNDQRVAALHNHHVFVVVMDMFRGGCSLTAGPECHLTFVDPIEHVTLNPGRGLIGTGDPVGGMFHELREGVHATGY